MSETPKRLTWKRSDYSGIYADSPDELLRYYVRRHGRRWTVEVFRTVETSGIRTVVPGSAAVDVDGDHDSKKIARAVAEAYDAEPARGPLDRMTRAVVRGYDAV